MDIRVPSHPVDEYRTKPNSLVNAPYVREKVEPQDCGKARVVVWEELFPDAGNPISKVTPVVDQQNNDPDHVGISEVGVEHREDGYQVVERHFVKIWPFSFPYNRVYHGIGSGSHLEHVVEGHVGDLLRPGVLPHCVAQGLAAVKDSGDGRRVPAEVEAKST